jgi:hypothetical protein
MSRVLILCYSFTSLSSESAVGSSYTWVFLFSLVETKETIPTVKAATWLHSMSRLKAAVWLHSMPSTTMQIWNRKIDHQTQLGINMFMKWVNNEIAQLHLVLMPPSAKKNNIIDQISYNLNMAQHEYMHQVANLNRSKVLTLLSLTTRLAQTATMTEMLAGAYKSHRWVHTSSNGAKGRQG